MFCVPFRWVDDSASGLATLTINFLSLISSLFFVFFIQLISSAHAASGHAVPAPAKEPDTDTEDGPVVEAGENEEVVVDEANDAGSDLAPTKQGRHSGRRHRRRHHHKRNHLEESPQDPPSEGGENPPTDEEVVLEQQEEPPAETGSPQGDEPPAAEWPDDESVDVVIISSGNDEVPICGGPPDSDVGRWRQPSCNCRCNCP